MKRTAIVMLLALVALGLWAQQVTKVGICDFSRVLNTSYRESKTVREFFEAQQTIKKEQAAIEQEIASLENQRLEADKAGNADLVLQLDKKLADKRRYLEDYKRIKGDWVRQQQQSILSGSNFLREIFYVICTKETSIYPFRYRLKFRPLVIEITVSNNRRAVRQAMHRR